MKYKLAGIGILAGAFTGIFGSGGGLILVPLLSMFCKSSDQDIFGMSLSITLPMSAAVLLFSALQVPLPFRNALPFLIGGMIGGILVVRLRRYIPEAVLHKALGILILWGGIRFLF